MGILGPGVAIEKQGRVYNQEGQVGKNKQYSKKDEGSKP